MDTGGIGGTGITGITNMLLLSGRNNNSTSNDYNFIIMLLIPFIVPKLTEFIVWIYIRLTNIAINTNSVKYYEYYIYQQKVSTNKHIDYMYVENSNANLHRIIGTWITDNSLGTMEKIHVELAGSPSDSKGYFTINIPMPNKWIKITEDIELYIQKYDGEIQYDFNITATKNKETADPEIKKDSKTTINDELITYKKYKTINYILRSTKESYLNDFIKDILKCFTDDYMSRYNSKIRYMYTYKEYFKEKKQLNFSRFELNNTKNFNSIFFNDKKNFECLVNNFINKTGAYGFDGIQHRLGILLHGPPGSGKTSIIKALSNKLNRNIVNLPLSKVTTNSELFDIMYGLYYYLECGTAYKLDQSKVIFIVEDIDAIGSIVNRRSSNDSHKSDDDSKSIDSGSSDEDEDESEPEETDSDPKSYDKLEISDKSSKHDRRLKESKKHFKIYMKNLKREKREARKEKREKELKEIPDKLTLAGILNVLDGVIDSPNRIIIFTTNHPEKLDPALIRPGRIDYNLYLGNLNHELLIEMLEYYKMFTENERRLLINYDIQKTGAEIEQFIIKYGSDYDQFLKELCTPI